MKPLIAILLMLVLSTGTVWGQDAAADWMTFYYKKPSPDRFVAEVRVLAKKGTLGNKNAKPPIIVFLSQVMAQNPVEIDGWLTELQDLDESQQDTLLDAAWYSDTEQARAYFKTAGLDDYLKRRAPKILELDVDNPSTLDMLWGYFLATGQRAPIRRIVSAFRLSKYSGALKRYKGSKKTEQDKREAFLDVTFQAARWSVESNCRQHPLVLQHCEAIFADKDLPKDQSMWLGVVLAKVKPGKYSMQVKKTKHGEYGVLIGEEVEPSGTSEKQKVP